MRKYVRWGPLVGSAAIVIASLSPASASPQATPTYQGTWYEATAPDCTQTTVSGRWSVTLRKDGTASVSLAMFMDGKLHAAWGGNGLGEKFTWARTNDGYLFTNLSGWVIKIVGDDVRFDIPDRYPTCDGYALGTFAR